MEGAKDLYGFTHVKDSGERQEFDTGSVRDTRDGKGRYDLISPIALKRLAQHFENGAKKYGDRNWEKGQPISRYLDSAIRHLYNHLAGDRSEDHLAAVAWNAMAAIHTEVKVANGYLPHELSDIEEPHKLVSRLNTGDDVPYIDESEMLPTHAQDTVRIDPEHGPMRERRR